MEFVRKVCTWGAHPKQGAALCALLKELASAVARLSLDI